MSSTPPAALRLAALLVLLQGVGLLGIAAFYLAEIALGRAGDVALALFALALVVGAGAALMAVAGGLRKRRRWSRSPALLAQLFAIPIAIGLLQGGRWYVGVPLLVWSVALLVLLFTPALSGALDE